MGSVSSSMRSELQNLKVLMSQVLEAQKRAGLFDKSPSPSVPQKVDSHTGQARVPSGPSAAASSVATMSVAGTSASRLQDDLMSSVSKQSPKITDEEKKVRQLKVEWLEVSLPLVDLPPPPQKGA